MKKSFGLAGFTRARFCAGLLMLAAAATLLRILSLFFFYDINSGYHMSGALLPIITGITVAFAAVACIVFCYIPKLSVVADGAAESNALGYLFAIPALTAVYFIYGLVTKLLEYAQYGQSASRLEILTLVLAVSALIYFIIAATKFKVGSSAAPVFAILSALWTVTLISDSYFDMLVPMNSPNKTVNALALVASMMFLVSEMRLTMTDKNNRFRLFSVSLAVLLNAVSAIPSLAAHLCGAFGGSYSFGMGEAVSLSLLFPAIARLVSICLKSEPMIHDDPTSLPTTTD